MSSNWYYYDKDLDRYANDLEALEYEELAEDSTKRHRRTQGFFTIEGYAGGPLTAARVNSLLSELPPPYGYGVLTPLPIPRFPSPPSRPNAPPPTPRQSGFLSSLYKESAAPSDFKPSILEKEQRLKDQAAKKLATFEARAAALQDQLNRVRQKCEVGDLDAVRFMLNLTHARHQLPAALHFPIRFDFDQSSNILLCAINVPDFSRLNIQKPRGKSSYETVPVSAKDQKALSETILYSLCIRAAFLAAQCNIGGWYETIAVNAHQNWNDRATGAPKEGIIATLQGSSREFVALRTDQIEAKACFRHFKGIATPSVENIAPVRPIFTMNVDDRRIVQERDVDSELELELELELEENIAAMPWEDFEHLVRQVFEWEFGRNGIEVKVFRASRDHGVDAVMFDPDPLRGGKYVLQAKRYTRTVDVAAVRDLYGTVINEGANRGILVTTSAFGPDSREFVKDKPLTLVDGPNLIQMLRKHGRRYKIDLEEARRVNKTD